MNADGSDQRNLTRKPGNEVGPAWSPDGRAIVFTAVPPGQPLWVGGSRSASGPYRDVYVMNADGSEQRNLTHTRRRKNTPRPGRPTGEPSPSPRTTGGRTGSSSSTLTEAGSVP
jgi:Tol biopolymer transport system component